MKQLLNTLYIQTQGSYIKLDHDTLKIDQEGKMAFQVPLHHIGGIVAFGNVLFSPFLIHRCAEDGRSLVWLSQNGRFKARLAGPTTGNVLLRRDQHGAISQLEKTLSIARAIVAAKIQNSRQTLMRAAREAKKEEEEQNLRKAAQQHDESIPKLPLASTLDEIRGIEGNAARCYFGAFDSMIYSEEEAFHFNGRNKRPPRDPVNALLSFIYVLLVGECISACEGVGLDPQMGFLHTLRPGRPSLALDLMEELRSPFADRFVLSLINRKQIKLEDFETRPGGAVILKEDARKNFLASYQKKKQEEVPHAIIDSKVPFGLIPHIQARLLARHLRGDLPEYSPFIRR